MYVLNCFTSQQYAQRKRFFLGRVNEKKLENWGIRNISWSVICSAFGMGMLYLPRGEAGAPGSKVVHLCA